MTIKESVISEIKQTLNLSNDCLIHDFNRNLLSWGKNILMWSVDKTDKHHCDMIVISRNKISVGDIFIFSSKSHDYDFVTKVLSSYRENNPNDMYKITVTTRLEDDVAFFIDQDDRV